MRTWLGLSASVGLVIATAYFARGWRKPPPARILLDHWPVFLPLLAIMFICIVWESRS